MKEERKRYLDLLSICASFAVVLMHCNTLFVNFEPTWQWTVQLFIDTITYWNVPIFFMISGATLLDYRNRYSTKEFAKKRIQKTLLPFIFWTAIGFILALLFKVETLADLTLVSFINNILNSKYNFAYWFFLALFAIYTAIPVLSTIPDSLKIKIYSYMAFLSFLSYSLTPIITSLTKLTTNPNLDFPISSSFFTYVLLGYILDNIEIPISKRRIIYLLGFLGWALRFFGMLFTSFEANEIRFWFSGIASFNNVLFSSAVFIAFRYQDWTRFYNAKISKFIGVLASCSFGVYLLHNYLAIYMPKILNIDIKSLWYTFIGVFVYYGVSVIISMIFKKIPILKRVIP